jgi:serine/threonine-protein kinase ATR
LLPFAVEASWVTGKWAAMGTFLSGDGSKDTGEFNVDVGHALLALRRGDLEGFSDTIRRLQKDLARGLSRPTTASVQSCRDDLLKFHVLTEMELVSGVQETSAIDRHSIMGMLDRRLEVLGAFLSDKQYLLGVRRAAMQLSRYVQRLPCPRIAH